MYRFTGIGMDRRRYTLQHDYDSAFQHRHDIHYRRSNHSMSSLGATDQDSPPLRHSQYISYDNLKGIRNFERERAQEDLDYTRYESRGRDRGLDRSTVQRSSEFQERYYGDRAFTTPHTRSTDECFRLEKNSRGELQYKLLRPSDQDKYGSLGNDKDETLPIIRSVDQPFKHDKFASDELPYRSSRPTVNYNEQCAKFSNKEGFGGLSPSFQGNMTISVTGEKREVFDHESRLDTDSAGATYVRNCLDYRPPVSSSGKRVFDYNHHASDLYPAQIDGEKAGSAWNREKNCDDRSRFIEEQVNGVIESALNDLPPQFNILQHVKEYVKIRGGRQLTTEDESKIKSLLVNLSYLKNSQVDPTENVCFAEQGPCTSTLTKPIFPVIGGPRLSSATTSSRDVKRIARKKPAPVPIPKISFSILQKQPLNILKKAYSQADGIFSDDTNSDSEFHYSNTNEPTSIVSDPNHPSFALLSTPAADVSCGQSTGTHSQEIQESCQNYSDNDKQYAEGLDEIDKKFSKLRFLLSCVKKSQDAVEAVQKAVQAAKMEVSFHVNSLEYLDHRPVSSCIMLINDVEVAYSEGADLESAKYSAYRKALGNLQEPNLRVVTTRKGKMRVEVPDPEMLMVEERYKQMIKNNDYKRKHEQQASTSIQKQSEDQNNPFWDALKSALFFFKDVQPKDEAQNSDDGLLSSTGHADGSCNSLTIDFTSPADETLIEDDERDNDLTSKFSNIESFSGKSGNEKEYDFGHRTTRKADSHAQSSISEELIKGSSKSGVGEVQTIQSIDQKITTAYGELEAVDIIIQGEGNRKRQRLFLRERDRLGRKIKKMCFERSWMINQEAVLARKEHEGIRNVDRKQYPALEPSHIAVSKKSNINSQFQWFRQNAPSTDPDSASNISNKKLQYPRLRQNAPSSDPDWMFGILPPYKHWTDKKPISGEPLPQETQSVHTKTYNRSPSVSNEAYSKDPFTLKRTAPDIQTNSRKELDTGVTANAAKDQLTRKRTPTDVHTNQPADKKSKPRQPLTLQELHALQLENRQKLLGEVNTSKEAHKGCLDGDHIPVPNSTPTQPDIPNPSLMEPSIRTRILYLPKTKENEHKRKLDMINKIQPKHMKPTAKSSTECPKAENLIMPDDHDLLLGDVVPNMTTFKGPSAKPNPVRLILSKSKT